MILIVLESTLAPLLLGLIAVFLLWPGNKSSYHHLMVKCGIALGVGLGILSIIVLLWMVVLGSPHGFSAIEAALFALSPFVLLYVIKRAYSCTSGPEISEEALERPASVRNISIICSVLFISGALSFLLLLLRSPYGIGSDAMTIWNMRARFLFRGGEHWRDSFTNLLAWSHPDYPLLIPLNIVRGWIDLGRETQVVPAVLAFLFTFATVFVISSSLAILRGRSQGMLSALVLLGTPFFIKHGASQYADVPLGFFFAVTLILFVFYDRSSMKNHNLLALAGLTAGFAAWTKNEGLLFLVSIFAARFLIVMLRLAWRTSAGQMCRFACGLLPVLLVIIYFKTRVAPPNDLVASQGMTETWARLVDFSRYLQIFKAYIAYAAGFTKGIVGVPLLTVYLLLLGTKKEEMDRISVKMGFATIALMLAGYFFVYVTTPHDLIWHLKTSLRRLFLQLWPSFVFCFFLMVKTIEEASSDGKWLSSAKN